MGYVHKLVKPDNEEFSEKIIKKDVENLLDSNDLTIEHIMPQTLTSLWKKSLGTNYEMVHQKYLHTIGNITLTGYNSEMKNKPFI